MIEKMKLRIIEGKKKYIYIHMHHQSISQKTDGWPDEWWEETKKEGKTGSEQRGTTVDLTGAPWHREEARCWQARRPLLLNGPVAGRYQLGKCLIETVLQLSIGHY